MRHSARNSARSSSRVLQAHHDGRDHIVASCLSASSISRRQMIPGSRLGDADENDDGSPQIVDLFPALASLGHRVRDLSREAAATAFETRSASDFVVPTSRQPRSGNGASTGATVVGSCSPSLSISCVISLGIHACRRPTDHDWRMTTRVKTKNQLHQPRMFLPDQPAQSILLPVSFSKWVSEQRDPVPAPQPDKPFAATTPYRQSFQRCSGFK